MALNRGSNRGRQQRPELLLKALNVLGNAMVFAITLAPYVGKTSISIAKESRLSIWNETIRVSSWKGSRIFLGIKSDNLEEIVSRAAGYLLSWKNIIGCSPFSSTKDI